MGGNTYFEIDTIRFMGNFLFHQSTISNYINNGQIKLKGGLCPSASPKYNKAPEFYPRHRISSDYALQLQTSPSGRVGIL